MFESLCDFATRGGIFSSQVGLVDVLAYVILFGAVGAFWAYDARVKEAVRAAQSRERRLAARELRRELDRAGNI